jgi:hypothetical protein
MSFQIFSRESSGIDHAMFRPQTSLACRASFQPRSLAGCFGHGLPSKYARHPIV